jgi:acetamidase/formamidase
MSEFAIQEFRGRLIGPSDHDCDEARALYNGIARVNPVVGAVYIDGAEPGDAVKVTLLSLQ